MTRAGGAPLGSRYTLEEPISAGAMGEVWRARDNRSGGQVAAKLLKEHHEDDPEVIARFINERKLLLALDHPGVVGARDMVVEGDTLAIIMDLVEGPDLAALLREHGPLAEDRAAAVGAGVLGALAAAQLEHASGDLGPAHHGPLTRQVVGAKRCVGGQQVNDSRGEVRGEGESANLV